MTLGEVLSGDFFYEYVKSGKVSAVGSVNHISSPLRGQLSPSSIVPLEKCLYLFFLSTLRIPPRMQSIKTQT